VLSALKQSNPEQMPNMPNILYTQGPPALCSQHFAGHLPGGRG